MRNVFWWLILAAIFIVDRILKKKCPRVWKALELPTNIVATILCLVYICIQGVALYKTWTSDVSLDDKIVLSVVCGGAIAVFSWLIVSIWKRWRKERKAEDEKKENLKNETI